MTFPINEKRGLWDNIHAKRKRIKRGSGEKMRKPGSEGAPTEKALKQSQTEEMDMFDFVYDFLISENLNVQEVLDIMARVPIEEILEVIELDEDEAWRNRNFRDFPDRSIENVARKGKELSQEIEDIGKRRFSGLRPGLRKKKKKKKKQLGSLCT